MQDVEDLHTRWVRYSANAVTLIYLPDRYRLI